MILIIWYLCNFKMRVFVIVGSNIKNLKYLYVI